MAFVMVGSGLILEVAETYEDVISGMDGPDLFEVHVAGDPVTFRATQIIGVSDFQRALRGSFPTAPLTTHEEI